MPKHVFEDRFCGLLASLAPRPGLAQLVRAIVTDVWKDKQADAGHVIRRAEAALADVRVQQDRLLDAYLRQRIDDTYGRKNVEFIRRIEELDQELANARAAYLNVDELLEFTERLLNGAAIMWPTLPLPAKDAVQRALFPDGLDFSDRGFGTPSSFLLYSDLQESADGKEDLVDLTGFEPVTS